MHSYITETFFIFSDDPEAAAVSCCHWPTAQGPSACAGRVNILHAVGAEDIQFLMPPISVASIRYKHIAEKSHHPTCDSYISDSNLATEAREDLCRLRTPSFMEEFNPMLTDMKGWWETHSQVLRDFDEKNITLLSQSEKIALSLLSRTFLPF